MRKHLLLTLALLFSLVGGGKIWAENLNITNFSDLSWTYNPTSDHGITTDGSTMNFSGKSWQIYNAKAEFAGQSFENDGDQLTLSFTVNAANNNTVTTVALYNNSGAVVCGASYNATTYLGTTNETGNAVSRGYAFAGTNNNANVANITNDVETLSFGTTGRKALSFERSANTDYTLTFTIAKVEGRFVGRLKYSETDKQTIDLGETFSLNGISITFDGTSAVTIKDFSLNITASVDQTVIDALQRKIDNAMSAIYADKVGYPNREVESNTAISVLMQYMTNQTLGSPITATNYTHAQAAYNNVLALTDINLPKDGKVYVFTNVATDGSKHYIYENTSASQLQYTDRGEGDVNTLPANGKYICRKNGTYYTFVNIETGHYLIWKGASGGYNDNSGYEETYNETDCKLFVERALYTTSNMGNASSQEDLFGWICFGGIRKGYTGIDKCFLYTVSSGFNQDGNHTQRYGSNHSSMFIVEEASYPYNTANLQYNKDMTSGPTYSTIYLPFAMTIPEGVKAYGVTGTKTKESGEVMVLNKVADGEQATDVPTGGYLLYSETKSGSTTILPAASNPEPVDNNFTGSTTTGATLPTGTKWVLGKKSGIGFYRYTGATYPLGKAIYVTESQSARLAFSFEDIETAIQAVENGANADIEIYDLAGRRVQKATKGLYIINGKKVMVK